MLSRWIILYSNTRLRGLWHLFFANFICALLTVWGFRYVYILEINLIKRGQIWRWFINFNVPACLVKTDYGNVKNHNWTSEMYQIKRKKATKCSGNSICIICVLRSWNLSSHCINNFFHAREREILTFAIIHLETEDNITEPSCCM